MNEVYDLLKELKSDDSTHQSLLLAFKRLVMSTERCDEGEFIDMLNNAKDLIK